MRREEDGSSSVLYFDTSGQEDNEEEFQVVSTLHNANFVVEALFNAVEEGNLTGLEELFSLSSINPDQTNKHGETAVHIASGLGHLDILKLLHSKGANIHALDSHGDSAIYWAARQGHDAVIRYLYDQGVSVAIRNKSQETALHIAARYGHSSAVHLLCSYGSDVNARDEHEETALHISVWHGFPTIVHFLCQYGAQTSLKNKEEETPVHCAAARGHTESLRCLLEAGADVNILDKNGCSGLHLALRRHHIAVAQLLLQAGCDMDLQDKFGDGPIHIAAKEGLLPMVHSLHTHGAKLDVPSKSGLYPLYIAAQHGHIEVVRYLCLAGCHVDIRNKDGIMPEVAAQAAGHVAVADLLGRLRNDEAREFFATQLIPNASPPPRVKLKVFGPSGGGKTTLLDSLKCGGYFTGWFRRSKSPSNSSVAGGGRSSSAGTSHSSKSSIDISSDDGLSLSFDSHAFTRGIDVQHVHLSGVGEVSLWEFSGHEPYKLVFDHFLHDVTSLHLLVFSLTELPDVQVCQVAGWLAFLQAALAPLSPLGRGGSSQKRSHIVLVATHADEAGGDSSQQEEEASHVLNAALARCEDLANLDIHDTVFVVDGRQAASLKTLKVHLAMSRSRILQDVPKGSPFLEATISALATWRRGAQSFPVVSYSQFIELVRSQVNPLAGAAHLANLVLSLQIIGEIVYLRGREDNDDLVVLSPRWLCGDVLGGLLAVAGGACSVAEIQASFPDCDALDLLQVLEAMQLCAPGEGDIEFEFPCFLPPPSEGTLRPSRPFPFVGGLRIYFGSAEAQLVRIIFPRIQIGIRKQSMEQPLWRVVQNNGKTLVTLTSGIEGEIESTTGGALDIKVYSLAPSTSCFFFLHELETIVDTSIENMFPGLLVEKQPLGICDDIIVPIKGILEALHSKGIEARLDNWKVSELVLPGCGGVLPQRTLLGPMIHASLLPLSLIQRLAAVLDPPEPTGRDWCMLAVMLGLTDVLPRLDPGDDPTTSPLSRVILEWTTEPPTTDSPTPSPNPQATIGRLLDTLLSLGRPDAITLIYNYAPWVKVFPPEDEDTPMTVNSNTSCSNLSR